jgi:hypothetical protein
VPARLVDRDPVVPPGALLVGLVPLFAGGHRKKYRRAISRLVALNRLGVGVGSG